MEFKTGNIYRCNKDYIFNKQLAFKRDHLYLCKEDGFLEGCNGEIYNLKSYKVDNLEFSLEDIDNVNHPKHYTSHPSGIECIQIARHYCFTIGNAIKYLWRAGLKKDSSLSDKQKEIEDLNKAIWYIQDRINELKNN